MKRWYKKPPLSGTEQSCSNWMRRQWKMDTQKQAAAETNEVVRHNILYLLTAEEGIQQRKKNLLSRWSYNPQLPVSKGHILLVSHVQHCFDLSSKWLHWYFYKNRPPCWPGFVGLLIFSWILCFYEGWEGDILKRFLLLLFCLFREFKCYFRSARVSFWNLTECQIQYVGLPAQPFEI